MITKVIGAFAGDKLARTIGGSGGATGAALGVVAATVLRRMSLPAMIALGAGGYLAKKFFDGPTPDATKNEPPKTSKAPASA